MLKELKKCLKSEREDSNIFDIVLYGSFVKGKLEPEDIDILVIFKKGSLKERLSKIQLMKKKITLNKKIDIKSILLEELFHDSFFAKSGIFLEGISIFNNAPFSNKIDFQPSSIFIYTLKDKKHSEKVKFNYLLSGRNSLGMINRLKGKHLAPGVIEIPIMHSIEFEDILKKHNINYKRRNILVQK